MTAPIGLQLYSVREQLALDFNGTIQKIASMGYTGVETHDFPNGVTPIEAKALFDSLGLNVISSHSPLPLGDEASKVLDTLAAIECPHLVSSWMDPGHYQTEGKMKALAEVFNQAYFVAVEHGMKFSIHNHAHEFSIVDGVPAIEILKNYLEPGINFQLDTYYIQVAGQDPAEVVRKFGIRAPLLHIKDTRAIQENNMTAVGDGIIDVPAIIRAGEPFTEWLIVEIDRCDGDMMEAVDKSFKYISKL